MRFLSVIIPTKNEEAFLPRLLETLACQRRVVCEVLIADASSGDATPLIAAQFGCRVVRGGYPDEGRNAGAQASRAPRLLFLDADLLLPHPHYLFDSISEFRRRNLDVAGVLLKPCPTGNRARDVFYGGLYGVLGLFYRFLQHTRNPSMMGVMFSTRAAFEGIGGFRPYEFGQDGAFAKAAVRMGYRFGTLTRGSRVPVSMRRFEKKGIPRLLLQYVRLNACRFLGHEFVRGRTKARYWP
jgi:glycosyltransferase involved in cell wall biosynthesis